jgi:GntR family transcriptional regulator/MocR family aminotransferase
MLSNLRGLAASEEHIVVTRGAQMALSLVFRALIQPGDVVAVEDYGYPPAWAAMRASGARLVPIPVDDHGMQVRALERLADSERVRAVYVTPHHQWPTMAVLHPARRKRLLEIAERTRMAIVEDDYDHEYHYEGRPVLPLASTDRAGSVIYVGTLSKVLAPGLRLGYVVAPRPLVAKLAEMRFTLDRQGDAVTECAVAELLEEGEVQRHMWRTRRIYAARRDALVAELNTVLGDVLHIRAPTGGLALWARVRDGIDVDAWAKAAAAEDVTFLPGSACTFDGRSRPFARLGFARLDGAEMHEAVRRLRRAVDSIAGRR